MEAVPRLPMIYFELKISDKKTSFGPKLKNYIQYHYNEDAESFSNQINQIEGLRASATRPPRDVTGCATLKRYYCQLHFVISRFPMCQGGDAAVNFSWKDPYSDTGISATDVTVELASILYNIGALHSQLGASDNRSTADGMKMACTHFQCAAWAFQHISEEFPQVIGYDALADLYMFMNKVCLAQAQECILEKSMMDNRKATIIAKVAVQTVEYYKQSLKQLTSTQSYDLSVTLGSKLKKKWEMYLKFKISYHGCIGLLYQGEQSEEQREMGERVAYYQAAFEKLEEARKLSKGLDNIDAVNEALQFTQDVVEGKRKAAKNDNEFIYHEEVPNVATLPEMKGASLVKGIGFSVNDLDVSGPDIFGRLIPLKAHETSSIYSEELAKLLRKTTADVLKAENELETFLSSLQVDELRARDCWELPQEIVDRCAAISAKPDAIKNLQEAMNSLSDTYQGVENMLSEVRALLLKEEENVLGYEGVVGKRPPSIAATDLTREAKKYQDAHAKASESNLTLHKAMKLHSANLGLLYLPIRELQEQLPAVTLESPEDEAAVKQMETLMNKVKEMKQQRGMLVAQLREAINHDDITQKVVTFTGESKTELFQQEMDKHQKQVNLINQNLAAQENILAAIQEAYGNYSRARRNITSKLQRRDGMVASLIASYDAYEDLIAKSNKGLEFYNKLQGNVSKLLQRVKSTCKVQEEEREQILSSILEDVPRSTVRSGVASRNERPNLTSRDVLGNTRTSVESSSWNSNTSHRPQSDIPSRVYNDLGASSGGGLKLKDYLNMKKETGKMSLVSGPGGAPVYGSVGYVPATSPQLYEAPVSWVPGIRPAPVGSEETDPVNSMQLDSERNDPMVPRLVDSNRKNNWNGEAIKSNPYYYQYSDIPNNTSAQTNYKYNYAASLPFSTTQTPASVLPSYDVYPSTGYQQSYSPGVYNTTQPAQSYSQNYQDSTAAFSSTFNPTNFTLNSSQTYGGTYHQTPVQPVQPYNIENGSARAANTSQQYPVSSQPIEGVVGMTPLPTGPVATSYSHYNNSSIAQCYYPPTYDANNTDTTSYTTNNLPHPDAYGKNVPYDAGHGTDYNYAGYNAVNYASQPVSGSSDTVSYPLQSVGASNYSVSAPDAQTGIYVASSNTDGYIGGQTSYYAAPQYPSTNTQQSETIGYSTVSAAIDPSSLSAYQQPSEWHYIPQQGGGYNQDAGYLGSGNSSLYTQTQHSNAFTPTSSENYLATPKTLSLKQELYQSPSQEDNRFIPYPGENAATQSPVTYRQAGFSNMVASTTTTSSADTAKSSSSVRSSNVDLLAGLEFEVSQSPLLPQIPTEENKVIPQPPKQEVIEDKPKDDITQVIEEKKIDVDALKAFVPDVEKLEKFVEGLTLKTLNGPTTLDVKWKEIMEAQEKDSHSRSISVARCYPMKNRFPDILPYDDSRIELPSTKDDYINASFLKPLTTGMLPLILTQAPQPVTFGDFWMMVVEQQVEVVVCLLGDAELMGHIYWPESKGKDLTLGKLKLSLQTCNVRPFSVERIISVTVMDTKVTRVVVHLQFTAWPGSSFPASPAPFLGFVQEVKTFFQQQRSNSHPAVLHCLSGVGRSGLFCVVLAAVMDIQAGRGVPDLVALTVRMSQARKNSLQDREHLKFAYQSMLYFSQDLLLKSGILTNRVSFDDKPPKDGKCHTRHPSQDFLIPSDVEQLQHKFESLDSDDKVIEQDPISSRPSSSKTSSGRTSPVHSLLAAMDPNNFNLSTKESKLKHRQKFTTESFSKPSTLTTPTNDTPEDPLSGLDPLWSLKK